MRFMCKLKWVWFRNCLYLLCFASSNYTGDDNEMRFCMKFDVCEDPLVVWIGCSYIIMQKLLFYIIMQTRWVSK